MFITEYVDYKKLAIHNSSCNQIYFEFQDCLKEYPFKKYFGKCTNYGKLLQDCIDENRKIMREKNLQLTKEKYNKMRQGNFSN